MRERWQGWVLAVVVVAHVGVATWLSHAMAPVRAPVPVSDDMVMYIELVEPPPDVEPAQEPPPPADQPEPAAPSEPPAPTARRPVREPVAMEAVIEPGPEIEADAPREFVDPARDPFHRPQSPVAQGFGRRDPTPVLPDANRPRIAGERRPDAPLPELRARGASPQRIVETIGSFIGGGPNAPVDAPCGGRINGGFGTAESFSPAWQKHYGCGDEKDRAGYDGTVELPPGTRR